MTDLASLKLRIDATEVAAGAGELDKLTASGALAEAGVMTLRTAIIGAASAFATFKAAQYVEEAALLAARYETMGIVMKVAGNNAGYMSAQMEQYAKQLQQNGISMLQSRDALVQLATAHIDLSRAAALGRAAQDLAVVGNINSSDAMGRLIHGIKSGQTEILRTLGLNISFEKSYVSLAAQLGISSNALTEQQKTLARTNAVLLEAKNYAGIYEESMTTAGKAMTSLTRYSENLKIKLGEMFLPALADAVFTYTDALKAANAELDNMGREGTIDRIGAGFAMMFKTAYEAIVVLGANVVYVFGAIGSEIGGIAAQIASVLKGNFAAAAQIRKDMIADAEAGRKAIDAFSERMLAHGEAVKTVSKYSEDSAVKNAKIRELAEREKAGSEKSVARTAIHAAAVLSLENEAFKAQMQLLGVLPAQIKVYELAMKGATDPQIAKAQTAANAIMAAEKQGADQKALEHRKETDQKALEQQTEHTARLKTAQHERFQTLREATEAFDMTEEERAQATLDKQLFELEQQRFIMANDHALSLAELQAFEDAKSNIITLNAQKQLEINETFRVAKVKFDKMGMLEQTRVLADGMGNMLAVAGTKYRAMFEINKAYRTADAVISGWKAVQDSYAFGTSWGGPIGGAAMAAIALAATAANISAIQGASFGGGFGAGGAGGGSGGGSITSPSPLAPIEAPPVQKAGVMVNINLGDNGLFSASAVRDLIEKINEQIRDGATIDQIMVA